MAQILSMDELMSVYSIDDLYGLYKEGIGKDIDGIDEFFSLVESDCREAIEKGDARDYALENRIIEVEVDGVLHRIFGLLHSTIDTDYYKSSIDLQIGHDGDFLYEQGLENFVNPANMVKSVEFFDHCVFGVVRSVYLAYLFLIDDIFERFSKTDVKGFFKDAIVESEEGLNLFTEVIVNDSKVCYLVPYYLKLEYFSKFSDITKSKIFGSCLPRSYYMARFGEEYARFGNKDVVNHVVGGMHGLQIAYFLNDHSEYNKYDEIAKNHAREAVYDPSAYRKRIDRFEKSINYCASIIPSGLIVLSFNLIYDLMMKK